MAKRAGANYKVRCTKRHPSGRAVRGKVTGKIKKYTVAGQMTLSEALGKAMSDAHHKGVECCVVPNVWGKSFSKALRKQKIGGGRRRCFGHAE